MGLISQLENVYTGLPPDVRMSIKGLLGSYGHARSPFDALKRQRHARGKKRLDRAAREFAGRLVRANIDSIEGKACLEFGSGYILSEPVLFHLLGATRCTGLDYNVLATARGAWTSLRCAPVEEVEDAVQGLHVPADFRERLERLRRMSLAEFTAFMEREIRYEAPFDASVQSPEGRYDLMHSISVLEHLRPDLAKAIVHNLAASLAPGGLLINHIDLRDHRDLTNDPLAFLAETDYPGAMADIRGNRLRRDDWMKIFASIPGTTTRCAWFSTAPREKLPAKLAPGFEGRDPDEMCVIEIYLVTEKTAE